MDLQAGSASIRGKVVAAMSRIAVFGATGLTGGLVVRQALAQGRGAAMARIESARRLFGSIWFNEATTTAGIEALGWYHEKKDDVRIIGLGPEHDWSSHAADAFGLMCITAENGFRSARPTGFKRKGSAMAI